MKGEERVGKDCKKQFQGTNDHLVCVIWNVSSINDVFSGSGDTFVFYKHWDD